MGLELSEVEYVVLSHGHYDYFGGLVSALKTINKTNLPSSFTRACSKHIVNSSKPGQITSCSSSYGAKIAEEGVRKNQRLEEIRDRILAEDKVMHKLADYLKSHQYLL